MDELTGSEKLEGNAGRTGLASRSPSPLSDGSGGIVEQAANSILVADCGSSFTRVSFIERVETGYCFVNHAIVPTTVEPPWSDISAGVRYALEQISQVVGRPFLDDRGMLLLPEVKGGGADLFVVTSSAGQPLRVVLAGLVKQVSVASLERAATHSYTQVIGVIARDHISPADGQQPSHPYPVHRAADWSSSLTTLLAEQTSNDETDLSTEEKKIALIRQQHPDIVWVAGGTDGGCREPVRDLVETVALACTLVDNQPRPALVYAGNAELRAEVVDLVGEETEIKIIDNVRPTLDVENLAPAQAEFQSSYVQRKLQRLPGISTLVGWSEAPILSTAQALEYLVVYLERLYESGKGVLCADVGSASTTVAASLSVPADTSQAAGDSPSFLNVVPDLGVGYGAPGLLRHVGAEAIARWLPFEPEPGEVVGTLLNKGVRPTTIPQERRDLLIEQAAAREALRIVMHQMRGSWQHRRYRRNAGYREWSMPPLEPIIASGGILGRAPRAGQTVLMLLDAIEPVGITTLVLDHHGVAPALGAIAVTQPLAAVQALDAGAFLPLGTVVAPIGDARPGEVIMRVKIAFEQGGELEVEVKHGSLEVLPLHTGEKARLQIKPRRGISVGRTDKAVEINGGVIGLVIDARGRPLRLPSDPQTCRQLIQQWLWDMGA